LQETQYLKVLKGEASKAALQELENFFEHERQGIMDALSRETDRDVAWSTVQYYQAMSRFVSEAKASIAMGQQANANLMRE
jgi:hypothetical protein